MLKYRFSAFWLRSKCSICSYPRATQLYQIYTSLPEPTLPDLHLTTLLPESTLPDLHPTTSLPESSLLDLHVATRPNSTTPGCLHRRTAAAHRVLLHNSPRAQPSLSTSRGWKEISLCCRALWRSTPCARFVAATAATRTLHRRRFARACSATFGPGFTKTGLYPVRSGGAERAAPSSPGRSRRTGARLVPCHSRWRQLRPRCDTTALGASSGTRRAGGC